MPERVPEAGDSLKYVCDMLDQLKLIAAESGGPFLSYLIDMARAEAVERLRIVRQGAAASGKQ